MASSNRRLKTREEAHLYSNLLPEADVSEYFISKFNESLIKKLPEWDAARSTPTMRLVELERDLRYVLRQQREGKSVSERKKDDLEKQWKELNSKSLQLKEALVHFNTLIEENEEKRKRSENKIKSAESISLQYEQDIKRLENKIRRLHEVERELKVQIQKLEFYEDYMNEVVEQSDFKSIDELVERHETLVAAREDLAQRQLREMDNLEQVRTAMLDLEEERFSTVIGLNNEVSQLESELSAATDEALRWERIVCQVKCTAKATSAELTQVKSACWNLHQLMSKRKWKCLQTTHDEKDWEGQLVDIKAIIKITRQILAEARKLVEEEQNTMVAVVDEPLRGEETDE
ncbi:coiled-coil domain-containing protein 42 [Schistocerca americana]|uniref:coiled-coil domain-containing protein 42 n=1 Tax=Schistocerca americana TaxID=7009 RepID=UPI001F4F8B3E|nr:coiled-coil domain-containing protein 42 [Schistocerca americana]